MTTVAAIVRRGQEREHGIDAIGRQIRAWRADVKVHAIAQGRYRAEEYNGPQISDRSIR